VSSASAGTSIAPFTLRVKSKIRTFNYYSRYGNTLSCAACYLPRAVFSTAGTTGGGLYFYGPRFANPRTSAFSTPTSGYYFNPYWGAQDVPGITSSGGAQPGTELSGAVATLAPAGNPQAGPNFVVAPAQPGLVGISGAHSSLLPVGFPLRGTASSFLASNEQFNLASGAGPGTHSYTAVSKVGSRGKVRFTKGGDHANGFGGTLAWLGGTTGFRLISPGATPGNPGLYCTGGATDCYYRIPFNIPINAALSGGGQNTWAVVTDYSFVQFFNGGAIVTSTPFGTISTYFTTHPATTGTVVVSQPYASAFTLHTTHGSDNRTSRGAGNLTLVTGWLGHRVYPTTTSDFGGTTIYKFHFRVAPDAPSLARPSLGLLAGLMAIAATYVIRKRRLAK